MVCLTLTKKGAKNAFHVAKDAVESQTLCLYQEVDIISLAKIIQLTSLNAYSDACM